MGQKETVGGGREIMVQMEIIHWTNVAIHGTSLLFCYSQDDSGEQFTRNIVTTQRTTQQQQVFMGT